MDHALPDARDFGPGFATGSPAETRALGRRASERLVGGDVLLLWGPLGAGKTLFTKGVCDGLGVDEDVTSPTFTIANRYAGRHVVHHLDFYRLGPEDDLHDTGLDAIMDEVEDGRAVLLAEWPGPLLPWLSARVEFLVAPGADAEVRVWRLRGVPELPERWRGILGGEGV